MCNLFYTFFRTLYLLNQGANPNAKDRWGHTPINDALRDNHTKVAALLKKHGARE